MMISHFRQKEAAQMYAESSLSSASIHVLLCHAGLLHQIHNKPASPYAYSASCFCAYICIIHSCPMSRVDHDRGLKCAW